MRRSVSYFLTFLLIFTPALQASAKTKAKSSKRVARIQNYFVDPMKDLAWMTQKERASYIAFLYSLQLLVDAQLSGDMVLQFEPKNAKKASKTSAMFEFFRSIFEISEADAVFPLVPVAGALVVNAIRVGGPKAFKFVSSRAQTTTTVRATGEGIAGRWVGLAATGSSAAGVASLYGKSSDDKPAVPPPAAPAPEQAAEAPVEEPAPPPQRRKAGSSHKKPGAFCLFGGHPSAYVKSGSRVVCPAPEGTVNNSICEGVASPNFLCQSMGLSESSGMEKVTSKLCIPLRSDKGLVDLSVRCSEVFMNDFLAEVKAVDAEDLKALQDKISEGITALEEQLGASDVGFLKYCESSNAINRAQQAKPCEALEQMIEAFRKDLPTVAAQAEAPTTTPAATTTTTPATNTEGQQ